MRGCTTGMVLSERGVRPCQGLLTPSGFFGPADRFLRPPDRLPVVRRTLFWSGGPRKRPADRTPSLWSGGPVA